MFLSKLSPIICIFATISFFTACNDASSKNTFNGNDASEYNASTGILTDLRDNQSYKTVTIGTQTWMAQNLNYETSDSYCYYNTDENCKLFGRLYIWSAVMDSAGVFSTNSKNCGYAKTCTAQHPVRGICPKGWHVPSKSEFETLISAVGGDSIAGKVLKSSTGWNENGNGTDAFGFSAQPGGERYYFGDFSNLGSVSSLWSATEENDTFAYDMYLNYDFNSAVIANLSEYSAQSLRCVKD